jgi:hypothetical protein
MTLDEKPVISPLLDLTRLAQSRAGKSGVGFAIHSPANQATSSVRRIKAPPPVTLGDP